MKLRTLFVVAALGLGSLACGGGGGGGSYGGLPTVPLCSPFTDMALPVDDGAIFSCSDSTVSISYGSGEPKALFDKYYDALKAKASTEIVPAAESSGSWTGVLQDGNKMNYTVNSSKVGDSVYVTVDYRKSPM
jgi:hypothetical protein